MSFLRKGAREDPLLLLREGVAALDITLPQEALSRFAVYLRELQTWNARVNLTGLKSTRDMVIRHFLDSLAVLPFLNDVASLADLGSGAGFPGLVLKLARPELKLTLVESRGKKVAFLEYLVALWHLSGVEIIQAHLTSRLARKWGPRFTGVTSRAAFPLKRFLELAAPLLLPGGRALALKGPGLPPAEIEAAERHLAALHLEGLEFQKYRLPLSGEARLFVLAYKVR
jgi:16S rRNA (guanine527-N7)-methyltransferase|uniref:Ribosomal RNA small subunit methyltransferase G n=1 Tax=Desulfobacca acetoxidans TaxID=60893 RepID=A0A7C3UZA0_9BACT